MRLSRRQSRLAMTLVAVVGACWSSVACGQSSRDAHNGNGLNRRYSSYDAPPVRGYDRREPASYAASRRGWDPYTPYYNRPAIWPYYPRYYGSWHYGPYGYRYGFSPWFSSYGSYHWPNAWRIAEVGPVPVDRMNYLRRIPFAPYDPAAMISPADIGRGIPAVWAVDPDIECYYW